MQNNFKYNSKNKWFSIVLAMWIVFVITLITIMILEYMIPFSKNIKWIENSSKSYYEANTWLEEALWFIYHDPSNVSINERSLNDKTTNFSSSLPIWSEYNIEAKWTLLPQPWEWNSDNKNWNKISKWFPIQLQIWWDTINWLDLSKFKLKFKLPDSINDIFSSSTSRPIINWQISSNDNTLNANVWQYIESNEINNSNFILSDKMWFDLLSDSSTNIGSFYYTYCRLTTQKCVLKLSIIDTLELDGWIIAPHLEWQITSDETLPYRYTMIETRGKSYGYKKSLKIRVPQLTINEALDFTVFQ